MSQEHVEKNLNFLEEGLKINLEKKQTKINAS